MTNLCCRPVLKLHKTYAVMPGLTGVDVMYTSSINCFEEISIRDSVICDHLKLMKRVVLALH